MAGPLDIFPGLGGPDPLPPQFGDAQNIAGKLPGVGDSLRGLASPLATGGIETLGHASRGELTAPQQAELGQYRTGLTNQARQMFYGMGRTPDKDTAFISQTADIDAKVNAMAQQQIQSSIALGLGELSASSNFFGQSLGFDQAAINALITAGNAQIHQDEQYRKQLTDAFSAIGRLLGTVGGAAIGGPVGAAVGSQLGGMAGGSFGASETEQSLGSQSVAALQGA